MILRFRLGTVIADEVAQKSIWSVKGASANKPCMFCMNVVSVRSGLEGDGDVIVDTEDFSRFSLHTDLSVWKVADMLSDLAERRHKKS